MKELRRKSGYKAEEIAVQLDISVSTIRNWEQGRTRPNLSVDQFSLLCKLYQCDIDRLRQACNQSELALKIREQLKVKSN